MKKLFLSSLIAVFALTSIPVFAASQVWNFDTPANYSISDNTKAEINNSLGALKKDYNPKHVSSIINSSSLDGAYGIDVSGNYAFVAARNINRVQVIDISDVNNPLEVSFIDLTPFGVDHVVSLKIQGNYAYVTAINTDSLSIIDISDPLNPVHISTLFDDPSLYINGASGLDVSGNYAYVTGTFEHSLQIIDISDPLNPIGVGYISDTASLGLSYAASVNIEGNYAYVGSLIDDAFQVIDISDPLNPISLGVLFDNPSLELDGVTIDGSVAISGNYAYVVSSIDDGFQVIDISDSLNPVGLGNLTDDAVLELDGAEYVKIQGNYAYVSSQVDDGIQVIDISDPLNPIGVGSITDDGTTALNGARGIFPLGDYLLVNAFSEDGFEILDISQPYYTDSPYLESNTGFTYTQPLQIFTETLGTNNNGTTGYQISSDNGTTWQYWNGSAWTATIATDGTETSTATEINSNLSSFDASGTFVWRGYLTSATGVEAVEIDQILVSDSLTDTDNDGVPDDIEIAEGTNENDPIDYTDTDGDLVPDYVEENDSPATDPSDSLSFTDTDGDGVPDYVETTYQPNNGDPATDENDGTDYQDTDGDLVPDYVETIVDGTDETNETDFIDTDSGGVPDYIETILFPNEGVPATDENNVNDDTQDTDGDGDTDYEELQNGTDPLDEDDPHPSSGGGSSVHYTCKDESATNYNAFGRHKQSLCEYDTETVIPTQDNPFGGEQCPAHLIIHDFMKYGDTNGHYSSYNKGIVSEISILQAHINRLLIEQYGPQAAGPVDDYFRSLTHRGVERLQTRLNTLLEGQITPLVIDGIVGPFTRAAINMSC
ncbi:hypothetical protein FHS04_000781 [Mesoflavibacter sabulilitoris]|uniref:Peptidoglycan binding-like domain-containing protein n=1 Tax=Mesoflavibacter zeaxanthinifaciens subsp. sabulilitoris TaxID=1520893 RepID=A0A2T1N659_9FLAO|nr:hypothetical protein [Mesoflavibacter zeaxanthinifaciens]MBB3123284.1 hypothetical protein [Mesoflavibacter zeaxanthinifaciens subsp. sabulilitoris]PSG87079.1 hypothetical protein C7H61_13290 [Mesoflavibacter zeaxanthinifaciens subsp. sabulilitoris]